MIPGNYMQARGILHCDSLANEGKIVLPPAAPVELMQLMTGKWLCGDVSLMNRKNTSDVPIAQPS